MDSSEKKRLKERRKRLKKQRKEYVRREKMSLAKQRRDLKRFKRSRRIKILGFFQIFLKSSKPEKQPEKISKSPQKHLIFFKKQQVKWQ